MPLHSFAEYYGPWALIAGASEGLGLAFAEASAAQGLNLVLCARRSEPLERAKTRILKQWNITVRTLAIDLADPMSTNKIKGATDDIAVGLLVYNAAIAPIGDFLDLAEADLQAATAVNMLRPLQLIHHFSPLMINRGRGGIVLMASMAGLRGSRGLATYAATKAFTISLAESLWLELRSKKIDIVGCIGGAIATPGYLRAAGYALDEDGNPAGPIKLPIHVSQPAHVVKTALKALGKRPRVIPGLVNKIGALVMERFLSTKAGIQLMSSASAGLKDKPK